MNAPQTEAELIALRRSINRGCPFGSSEEWELRTAAALGLLYTLRKPGRPRKTQPPEEGDWSPKPDGNSSVISQSIY